MKKTGFTLAEALITLLIIGIVSAIMLPAITKIKPDEKKVAYLKAYDTLTKTINNIMNNSSYYSISAEIDEHVVNASRFPLFNTAPGIKNPNKRYEGNKKLCNIFADSLGARNPSCENDTKGEGYTPNLSANSNDVSFRTQNGMRWWFVPVERDAQNMVATLKTDVYVDVNPKGSNKCLYANDCADPDIYKFRIREDGRIYAMDAKGQGYIDTRRHWLKKDNIGVVANNDRGTRFTYEPDGGNNGGNGGGGGGGNEPPNNQPNNPDPNPNMDDLKNENYIVPYDIKCGDTIDQWQINCIEPEIAYPEVYKHDRLYYEYPYLLIPLKYTAQYPVTSDVTVAMSTGGRYYYKKDSDHQFEVELFMDNYTYGTCTIKKGQTSCIEDEFYYLPEPRLKPHEHSGQAGYYISQGYNPTRLTKNNYPTQDEVYSKLINILGNDALTKAGFFSFTDFHSVKFYNNHRSNSDEYINDIPSPTSDNKYMYILAQLYDSRWHPFEKHVSDYANHPGYYKLFDSYPKNSNRSYYCNQTSLEERRKCYKEIVAHWNNHWIQKEYNKRYFDILKSCKYLDDALYSDELIISNCRNKSNIWMSTNGAINYHYNQFYDGGGEE